MTFTKPNKKYPRAIDGFSLMELLVTISVFVLLSTAVLMNFREVDNSLILQNVAHQVAIIVRKAQISGISNQGITISGIEVFPSYGAHFDTGDLTGFKLFADLGGLPNGVCDPAGVCNAPERIQRYALAQGYKIKELCGNQKTSGPPVPTCALTRLDITFKRPNPDASLIGNGAGYADAEIKIQSRAGKVKTIVIWKTGQISIE